MVPHFPGLSGRPGWVRSSAWIWLFSSIDRTTAWAGGCIEADDVLDLFGEGGIFGTLEGAPAVGLQLVSPPDALDGSERQVHRLAMARPVQWVVSSGGSAFVRASTLATV